MGKQTCLDVIIDPRRDVATRRRLFDVWEKKIPAWDAAHGPLSGVMDTLTHTDTTQDTSGTNKQKNPSTIIYEFAYFYGERFFISNKSTKTIFCMIVF